MRYHVKGGTWKNVEDEILKAAVMKYGLNQWSRISSLLVRKSAKQCKERWYEWLDPKIKKTEWTHQEEQELLKYVEMLPCQWKTIGPLLNRTAYQCIEQFQKILDRKNTDQDKNSTENDPRKLRPGETDPNPEAKPARPDPIDLDEDLKDMLNEARARVANTRGKKAKRKIREKQLEEARRLSNLQKKRELKSAGIEELSKPIRKKKAETNYNVDIPFERVVPKGAFSGLDEKEDAAKIKKKGVDNSLLFLEKRNRDLKERKMKEQDEKNIKKMKNNDIETTLKILNKDSNNLHQYINKEEKIMLSEPINFEKNNIINNNDKANFDFLKSDLFN